MLTKFVQRIAFYLLNPWITFLLNFLLFGILRYKIRNIKELRRQYKALKQQTQNRPVLICMNHLTRIDPLVLVRVFTSPWEAFFHFTSFPWHVSEKKMVPHIARIASLITRWPKWIPISSLGSRQKLDLSMKRIKHILATGEQVLIFPEGRRTLTGYVENENIHYGPGEIVRNVPGCQVLCIYLRAEKQRGKSFIPAPMSILDVSFKLMEPVTHQTGLRASREISHQIIDQLVLMEKEYFARK